MKQGGHRIHRGHPALWATLTLAAFPIVSLATGWLGMDPFRSFAFGALASLFVLLLEGAVRGRWWIAEPAFARLLGDPAFGGRMIVVLGMLLFLFQTLLLTAFLTQGTMDANIVRFVLRRQCAAPQNTFMARLCAQTGAPVARIDAAVLAIREAAEKRFFSGGFVTCAVRSLTSEITPQTCTQTALVRCDRWTIGKIAGQPVSLERVERAVATVLTVQPDGTYRVDGWNDDPTTAAWAALGGASGDALNDALIRARPDMQMETFRRAMERLYAK